MNDFIQEIKNDTAGKGPQELLSVVWNRFGERIALATSMGAEDQVLTDMLCRITDRPNLFTLDTGRLPEETYDLMEQTQAHYNIKIRVLFPDYHAVEKMIDERGIHLFLDSVENRKLCCHTRKILPLKRGLAHLDAWICGLRREQSQTRTEIETIQWDDRFGLIKLNPLADWTTDQVWDYIHTHKVPYNKLHDQGYPSIGCACCTRAIDPGEDIRSGRWWWELPEHKECGLHWVNPQHVERT